MPGAGFIVHIAFMEYVQSILLGQYAQGDEAATSPSS